VSDPNFPVVHMTISASGSAAAIITGKAAGLLAAAIDAANHLDLNVTVWIEVTQPRMPLFVAEALDRLAGYGAAIVITHASWDGILCSHPPGRQLPRTFVERLARASRAGRVWHPILHRVVLGIDI
jgi:hypothetical protein